MTSLLLFFVIPTSVQAQTCTAVPTPAGVITVDGNPYDWSFTNLNTFAISSYKLDAFGNGQQDTSFTEGSKDFLTAAQLTWTYGQTKAKNDIANGAAVLVGNTLYFAGDRTSNNGDAQIGFWFYLNGTAPDPNTHFSPPHAVGDLLVLADFTGGGNNATVTVYKWVGTGGNVPNTNGTLNTISCVNAIVAENNTAQYPIPTGWTFNQPCYDYNMFYEGSIDLTCITSEINSAGVCFSGFLLETRSSQSITASLDDFVGGSFAAKPQNPSVTGAARCGTGSVTLQAGCTGQNVARWYAASSGGAVLFTGSSYTTPSISSTTTYYVSCYNASINCESDRVAVTATINTIPGAPQGQGAARCGNGTLTLTASGCTGTYNWYAAAAGGASLGTGASFTTPSLSATTTYYVSCTQGTCEGPRTAVTATVNAIPGAPQGQGAARCGTGTVTLSASGCTGTLNWYAAAAGGASLGTGASFTTPSISATTTYYVSCTSAAGCEGPRTAVTATVNDIPGAPQGQGAARCGEGTVTLTASGCTGTLNWYAAAAGGASLGTGASFTTPSLTATTTYYVSCTSAAGCEGPRTAVTATINPGPSAPQGQGAARCGTGTVTLSASGCTGTLNWYAAAAGGASLGTGASFTTPSISATTTYYVSCTSAAGCESGRTAVTATVNTIPGAPQGQGAARCGTGTVTLSASGCTGTLNWYAAAAGGASLGTGASFTTPSISATTTYYVSCTSAAGCEGPRTAVTATVNAVPGAPGGVGAARCGAGTLVLTASGCTGTYTWYNAASGGSVVGTGASFTTPVISVSTTYWVSCTSGAGCEGPRTAVTAGINAVPTIYVPQGSSICQNAPNTGTVTLPNSQIGVNYQLKNDQGNVQAPKPGTGSALVWSNLAAGTYAVDATSTTSPTFCNSLSPTAVVQELPLPNVTADDAEVCVGATVTLVGSPAGGTWTSPYVTNGVFNAAGLGAGVYTVTYSVTSGGCTNSTTADVTVTICGAVYCTYTQGAYGNQGGMSCEGTPGVSTQYTTDAIITRSINNQGGMITIGKAGRSVTVTANANGAPTSSDVLKVIEVLPGGGGAKMFPHSGNIAISTISGTTWLKNGRINNGLFSQTLTLSINVGVKANLAGLVLEGGQIVTADVIGGCGGTDPKLRQCNYDQYGNLVSVTNEYQYTSIDGAVVAAISANPANRTVAGLLDLANRALANTDGIAATEAGVSLSAIAGAVDAINNAFDECRVLVGFNIAKCPTTNMSARGVNNVTVAKGKVSHAISLHDQLKVSAYPNPFNEVVKFTIESKVSGKAQLEVFNMMGQRISTVYNGFVQANKGMTVEYIAPVSAQQNLIYVLTINGEKATGKLLSVK